MTCKRKDVRWRSTLKLFDIGIKIAMSWKFEIEVQIDGLNKLSNNKKLVYHCASGPVVLYWSG